jgi:PEGA domain-containing protein
MSDRAMRMTAPEHRVSYSEGSGQRARTNSDGQRTPPPTASGSSSSSSASRPAGDRAVSRGVASNNGGDSRRANESTATNNANGTSEVPNWSRPRGDRPATDTAVTRVTPRPDRNPDHGRGGDYYYDPYYYGGFGYGLGLGYYDTGFYGYPFYAPFGLGYGIPYGYFDPYSSDPYSYGGGYGAYSSHVYGGHDQGNLKLKVKPRNAKVYVDGYYVGLVDEFDGAFQKLTLNGGRHKVELRADGYETTEFDVLITPEQTITFAGDMKKVQ